MIFNTFAKRYGGFMHKLVFSLLALSSLAAVQAQTISDGASVQKMISMKVGTKKEYSCSMHYNFLDSAPCLWQAKIVSGNSVSISGWIEPGLEPGQVGIPEYRYITQCYQLRADAVGTTQIQFERVSNGVVETYMVTIQVTE